MIKTWTLLLGLVQNAKIVEDSTRVNNVECDLCKCTDRFWPNCTAPCQQIYNRGGGTVSLNLLEEVLNGIGSTCQVFADVTFTHRLEDKEWCKSTTPDRQGFVIETPATSADGYNMVRAQLLEQYVRIRGRGFECGGTQAVDGYITYQSEFKPSSRFCHIHATPEGHALQLEGVESDGSLTVQLAPNVSPQLEMRKSHGEYASEHFYNTDSYQPITLRYLSNNRTDGNCYGEVEEITLTRRVAGYMNGRNYAAFRASGRDDEIRELKRIYHTAWTGAESLRPNQSGVWDLDSVKNAPGFDLVQWR